MPQFKPTLHIPEVQLTLESLYLKLARHALSQAESTSQTLQKLTEEWNRLEEQERILRELEETMIEGNLDQWVVAELMGDEELPDEGYEESDVREWIYAAMEEIAISLVDYLQASLDRTYGELIENLVLVHICSCCAVEAHINTVARLSLRAKAFEYFENMPLEGKWLLLPQLNQWEPFNPGLEPFQSFSMAVKYRNKLVHYKPKKELWRSGQPPEVLGVLGLTIDDGWKSLEGCTEMIRELHIRQDIEEPSWLSLEPFSYFDLSFKDTCPPE